MSEVAQDSLLNSVKEVLENMAFIFTREWQVEKGYLGELSGCQMNYYGPYNGAVELWIPYRLLRESLENLLENTDPSLAKTNDWLKELTNMITNRFLTEQYGSKDQFQTDLPVLQEKRMNLQDDRGEYIWIDAEGEPIMARILTRD